MQRDLAYLLDILQEATQLRAWIERVGRDQLTQDWQLQHIAMRGIEIMGEAARRVSESYRGLHPEIPWHAIIGMRNRAVHEYDRIDWSIVWHALHDDLDELINQLMPLVPPDDGEEPGQDARPEDES